MGLESCLMKMGKRGKVRCFHTLYSAVGLFILMTTALEWQVFDLHASTFPLMLCRLHRLISALLIKPSHYTLNSQQTWSSRGIIYYGDFCTVQLQEHCPHKFLCCTSWYSCEPQHSEIFKNKAQEIGKQ